MVYDTMYDSTATMAKAYADGVRSTGVDIVSLSVRGNLGVACIHS